MLMGDSYQLNISCFLTEIIFLLFSSSSLQHCSLYNRCLVNSIDLIDSWVILLEAKNRRWELMSGNVGLKRQAFVVKEAQVSSRWMRIVELEFPQMRLTNIMSLKNTHFCHRKQENWFFFSLQLKFIQASSIKKNPE